MEIDIAGLFKKMGLFSIIAFAMFGIVFMGTISANKAITNTTNVAVSNGGGESAIIPAEPVLKINAAQCSDKAQPTNADIMSEINSLSQYVKEKSQTDFESKMEEGQKMSNVQQYELNQKVDKILKKIDPESTQGKINSADDLAKKMAEHTGASTEECYRKISELEHDSRMKQPPVEENCGKKKK